MLILHLLVLLQGLVWHTHLDYYNSAETQKKIKFYRGQFEVSYYV
jgi:hypothetical protein